MDKTQFRAQFFTRIREIAANEGFTSPKWKKGATSLKFAKALSDGEMTARLFLDSKYLPRVEVYFDVSYPVVSEVLFDHIRIERPNFLNYDEGWPSATSRFGDFLYEKGFLERKHATGTSFDLSERGLEEAVAFVQQRYFVQAARMIASDTDTMAGTDALINGHLASLGYPDEHICLPHFMYTTFQSITGTVLACMFLRDDRQRLAEYHVKFMEDWAEGYQRYLAKVVNYYLQEGVLSPTPELNVALKYLK